MTEAALDQSNEETLRLTALQFALQYSNTTVGAALCDYLPDVAYDVLQFLKGEYNPYEGPTETEVVTSKEDNVIHVDFRE